MDTPDCTPDLPACKACTRCGEIKPLDSFYVKRERRDGRCSRCKSCESAVQAASQARARYRAEHLEQRRRDDARRRADPQKRAAERAKQREYASRPDVRAKKYAGGRERYAAGGWAKVRARHAQCMADPECAAALRAYRVAWREANRDRVRHSGAVRRARKKNAEIGPPFTRSQIFERDGGRCHICGKKCNPKNWHLDHLVSLKNGGAHAEWNVAVSCKPCNEHKGANGPAQLRFPEA